MRDIDEKPIKSFELSSELNLGELDTVSGGMPSLDDVVKQMVMISNILKNMADTQAAIIHNLR